MADDTTPARDRRVFEEIFDRIRADLAGGRLKPGDKLPAERLLAEQLGVSRSAVREAVRALEASGVVSLQKGVRGGSFINNASADGVSRSINDVIVLGDIPLRQVMEVRSLLLGKAAQMACDRATDAEIEAVAEVIRRLEAPGLRNAQRMDCIREFYILIGQASGNRMLEILIDATSNISLDFATTRRIPFTPELIPMQQAVVSRLRARDGDGAARAIGETLAFLHGFVIARAIDAGRKDGAPSKPPGKP